MGDSTFAMREKKTRALQQPQRSREPYHEQQGGRGSNRGFPPPPIPHVLVDQGPKSRSPPFFSRACSKKGHLLRGQGPKSKFPTGLKRSETGATPPPPFICTRKPSSQGPWAPFPVPSSDPDHQLESGSRCPKLSLQNVANPVCLRRRSVVVVLVPLTSTGSTSIQTGNRLKWPSRDRSSKAQSEKQR